MAKKIKEESNRKGEGEHKDVYPWLRLLELEVQPQPPQAAPQRGRGRPPSPFPRKAVHVTLTDEEVTALDQLAETMSELTGTRLHRGHVIAFMTYYMQDQLGVNPPISGASDSITHKSPAPNPKMSLSDLLIRLESGKSSV